MARKRTDMALATAAEPLRPFHADRPKTRRLSALERRQIEAEESKTFWDRIERFVGQGIDLVKSAPVFGTLAGAVIGAALGTPFEFASEGFTDLSTRDDDQVIVTDPGDPAKLRDCQAGCHSPDCLEYCSRLYGPHYTTIYGVYHLWHVWVIKAHINAVIGVPQVDIPIMKGNAFGQNMDIGLAFHFRDWLSPPSVTITIKRDIPNDQLGNVAAWKDWSYKEACKRVARILQVSGAAFGAGGGLYLGTRPTKGAPRT